MAIPFLQRKMAVLFGILHKCSGAFGRMDSGGEKEAVHGLPCTAEGDKGSVHSGALVAQEEHGHRAGAAMGADDGADVAQADLAPEPGEPLLQSVDEHLGVLRALGVAHEALAVVVHAALSHSPGRPERAAP